MVLAEKYGTIVLFLLCLAASVTVFGYLLIRKRKPWMFFAAVIFTCVIFQISKSMLCVTIIECLPGGKVEKYFSIGFPLYKAQDGQEIKLRNVEDYLYINSSNIDMVLVAITYGKSYGNERDGLLNNHSHFFHDKDFWYKPNQIPPQEMYVKSRGETYYWLTTLEKYQQLFPEDGSDSTNQ